MKKICLIAPAAADETVSVALCLIGVPSGAMAVAVYVVLAAGETVAVPCGSAHGEHTALSIESALVVPPLTCQLTVAGCPAVIVEGVTLRLKLKGTVTVTDCGALDPPGPVAMIVNVVVLFTGGLAEPEVGSVIPSSGGTTGGLMLTEVALVVAQLMVVVCAALTEVGLAVKDVTCGGTGWATLTVIACGGVLVPELPVATAL